MNSALKVVSHQQPEIVAATVLEVEHLGKSFPGHDRHETTVLDDVSFSIRPGELVCLLGRSGCGKSTLLNLVAGFSTATSGVIRFAGQPVRKPGAERCVVFQEDALFPWLTLRENIALGVKKQRMPKQEQQRRVNHYLELVGLADFAKYLPREVSGGMKQRVALARVLALQPQLLLMDEPFAALDAQTREEMQALLLSLWQRLSHTILFVTHDVSEAVLLADRVLLFAQSPGRISRDLAIDLDHPRRVDSELFQKYCRIIRNQLGGG